MIFKIIWHIRAIIYRLFFGSIGSRSYLGNPIFIYNPKKIHIGSRVRIFPHARMEVHGSGAIKISDNVSIGNDLHIACGGKLEIGTGTQISSFVLITDIDHEYEKSSTPIFDQPLKIRAVYIGKNCFIGSGARILAGTYLADGCVIGANTIVRGKYYKRSVIAAPKGVVIKELGEQGFE